MGRNMMHLVPIINLSAPLHDNIVQYYMVPLHPIPSPTPPMVPPPTCSISYKILDFTRITSLLKRQSIFLVSKVLNDNDSRYIPYSMISTTLLHKGSMLGIKNYQSRYHPPCHREKPLLVTESLHTTQ